MSRCAACEGELHVGPQQDEEHEEAEYFCQVCQEYHGLNLNCEDTDKDEDEDED